MFGIDCCRGLQWNLRNNKKGVESFYDNRRAQKMVLQIFHTLYIFHNVQYDILTADKFRNERGNPA